MEYTYTHVINQYGTKLICRQPDGAWVGQHPDNCDYMHYLSWMADGNVPEEISFQMVQNE